MTDSRRATLPQIVLVRHGATEWSESGRHTGRTDVPLTALGQAQARALAPLIPDLPYAEVRSSPSSRARDTARLAGFASCIVDSDLAEWHYGDFEGLTTPAIRDKQPGWTLFRDGCPGGEGATDVEARADRVIASLRAPDANVLLFSSGHFLRAMAGCWVGLGVEGGARLALDTASVSILGYDHDRSEPVLRQWNCGVGSVGALSPSAQPRT